MSFGWQMLTSEVTDGETGTIDSRIYGYGMGGELLKEWIATPSVDVTSRVYVNGGVDQPLWSTDVAGSNVTSSFWLRDLNGSVFGMSNAEGLVQERQSFDAFGNTRITDPQYQNERSKSAIGNRLGFQGRTNFGELGLQYFRNRFYSPDIGRFISSDPLGMVDGPNTYGFCGGDPVNRVDPMGLWWFWDENKNDWVWIGAGKQTPRPTTHEGSWGHHHVTRASVADRAKHISGEARMYFEGGENMFTGWPKGLPPGEWHNRRPMGGVTHAMYDNYIGAYLDAALETHKANGTKMAIDEAVEFGEFIRGRVRSEDLKILNMKDVPKGYVSEIVSNFSRACVAERNALMAERRAALIAEESASRGRARKGSLWKNSTNILLALTAVAAVSMSVNERVEAGESLPAVVVDTVKKAAEEIPKQPILQVESTVVTLLNAKATEDQVTRVLQTTANSRERERYSASIDKAHRTNDSTLWIPRGGETVRAFDDQARAHAEGAVEGVKGMWNETAEPVCYWAERGFLYLLSIGAEQK